MTRYLPHPIWWEMIRASLRRAQAYRSVILFWFMRAAIQLLLLRMVWTTVYAGRDEVDGVSATTLLVHITIASLHNYVLGSEIAYLMDERISTGQVALDLVRPFGFLKQMAAEQIGGTLGLWPVFLASIPVGMVIGSLRPPSPELIPVYLVSLLLAFIVNTLVWMQVGLSAFWMLNAAAAISLASVISSFLSGALVPLWFMPDWLRWVVHLLPFQAVAYLPASIYAGQVHGREAIWPIVVQLVWIAILLATIWWTWTRAQRKLVIQGG